jgi:hypothetical protein
MMLLTLRALIELSSAVCKTREKSGIQGQVGGQSALLQGVYILLATVYICLYYLLQLAMMTEHILLITAAHDSSTAHDIIGSVSLLRMMS